MTFSTIKVTGKKEQYRVSPATAIWQIEGSEDCFLVDPQVHVSSRIVNRGDAEGGAYFVETMHSRYELTSPNSPPPIRTVPSYDVIQQAKDEIK